MSGLKLIVVKGDTSHDMSELVSSVKWSGRKGSAARSLSVTFIDDDGYGHTRTGLDVEQGHQCIFYWNGVELFRGLFMQQEQSRAKTMTATAYDNGIYLANNKDTFNYTSATASAIFADCCKRFGIPYGAVADTSYQIPELTKPRTTAWDTICDALSLTYKAAGIRYYPLCVGDEMRLLERRENILQWVIETGVNLEEYRLTKSIEKVKTRIKLLSKEGEVLAQAVDSALEKKVGVFQDVETADEEMNTAQLNELVKTTLEENNKPERALTVNALGLTDVVTGVGVFIIIKELGISKTYYVEEDAHSFQGEYHSMNLKLSIATDLDRQKTAQKAATADIKAGDIVQFAGGLHYVSSTAGSPTGGTRKGGPAKCTLVAKGAKHPYHLIGGAYTSVEGSSNVYGWVDASTVSK
ncbi:hypothetical protein [Clostridium sp. D33t1_170424_F3]|uniref:XkdQ/YqbQ family protein n=1 Tax=Clostridium sp. D33t1_170424_F3 TaxID=2787099 RepID=UPI0018AC0852|nr:hypothetical protein [Clostridium sp. D33t1_170424_F3]